MHAERDIVLPTPSVRLSVCRSNAGIVFKQAVTDAAAICLRPLQVDNIFVFIRQVALVPACWLVKTLATS